MMRALAGLFYLLAAFVFYRAAAAVQAVAHVHTRWDGDVVLLAAFFALAVLSGTQAVGLLLPIVRAGVAWPGDVV